MITSKERRRRCQSAGAIIATPLFNNCLSTLFIPSPGQRRTDDGTERVRKAQRQALPDPSREPHHAARRRGRAAGRRPPLPSVPIELQRLRAPLLLESVSAAVDSRTAEVESLATAFDRHQQHFPVKLHVDAQRLRIRAAGGPRNLGTIAAE